MSAACRRPRRSQQWRLLRQRQGRQTWRSQSDRHQSSLSGRPARAQKSLPAPLPRPPPSTRLLQVASESSSRSPGAGWLLLRLFVRNVIVVPHHGHAPVRKELLGRALGSPDEPVALIARGAKSGALVPAYRFAHAGYEHPKHPPLALWAGSREELDPAYRTAPCPPYIGFSTVLISISDVSVLCTGHLSALARSRLRC